MAGEVEEDRSFLPPILRLEGQLDGPFHGMVRFGRRNQPFRPREERPRLVGGYLIIRSRLDVARVNQEAQGRSRAVIPETSRVNPRRDKRVA